MKLGIILSSGEGLRDQKNTGQLHRFQKFYLKTYEKFFDKIFIFSYKNETENIYEPQQIIPNQRNFNRFIYSLLMPIVNSNNFKKVGVLRVMQTPGGVPALAAKLLFKTPYLVTYGYKYHKFAQIEGKFFISFALRILEPLILVFADAVIVTTDELKNYVSRFANLEKIHLIPNGVDVVSFKPPKKTKKKKNEFVILSVGRLEIQKNYLNLVQAVASSKYNNNIVLKLVGKGSQAARIKKLAREKKVKLTILANVSHSKMPKIYNSCDVFVLPSLIEGHPKVLIEAMSCGLSVIGSNVSGNRELISDGRTGFLCGTDKESISEKIDNLIDNKKLGEQVGLSARKSILESYDIRKLILKEIVVLKKIAKND